MRPLTRYEAAPDIELSGPRERLWYACYTRSRHEKRVAETLKVRGFEAYLPLVSRTSHWHDRDKTILWPLYPGYVFAQLHESDFSAVMDIAGVASLVGSRGRPLPIEDGDIDTVRRVESLIAQTGQMPAAEPLVDEGQEVRIVSGPLAGSVGTVLQVRGGKRVLIQVGLPAIGQGVKLELDAHDLHSVLPRGTQAVGA